VSAVETGFQHRTWLSGDGLTLHARDYAAAEGGAIGGGHTARLRERA